MRSVPLAALAACNDEVSCAARRRAFGAAEADRDAHAVLELRGTDALLVAIDRDGDAPASADDGEVLARRLAEGAVQPADLELDAALSPEDDHRRRARHVDV